MRSEEIERNMALLFEYGLHDFMIYEDGFVNG